ncbi:hypothetical protein [Neisseria shayeganii]|uniref:Uncharacterized protein n=1 Tax=Neisseria shayeganii TaxID=607712 RepID=A0A7D7N754_9NEIS|nr:hypothetical protein [Neisseria shayeganii]QMT41383.1 hypothetical protein H3L94_04990 [Neisseria shayeganii]
MFGSVDEALYRAFEISSTPIVTGGYMFSGQRIGTKREMTRHDWHAQAALVLARVERQLSAEEYALIRAEYGKDLSGIIDLSLYILTRHPEIPMLACDDLVEHALTGERNLAELQNKHGLSKSTVWRHKRKVVDVLADLHLRAMLKLEADFQDCKLTNIAA